MNLENRDNPKQNQDIKENQEKIKIFFLTNLFLFLDLEAPWNMQYRYATETAVRRLEESKIYVQDAVSVFRSKNASTLQAVIRKQDGVRN